MILNFDDGNQPFREKWTIGKNLGICCSVLSVTITGLGILLATVGIWNILSNWERQRINLNFLGLEITDDEDGSGIDEFGGTDSSDEAERNSPRDKLEKFIAYGLLISVEVIMIGIALQILVPWLYGKALTVLRMDPSSANHLVHLLHSFVWLIAGVLIYAFYYGFLNGDRINRVNRMSHGAVRVLLTDATTEAEDMSDTYYLEYIDDDDDYHSSSSGSGDSGDYDENSTEIDEFFFDEDP